MAGGKAPQSVAIALFVIIVSAYLVMVIKFPLAYIVATYEDLAGEWMQVFFWVVTLAFSARLAFSRTRFRRFFTLLALASFYALGEEISWGQRLFDIPTPEFFQRYNQQGETNLHNFFTGPDDTLLKRSIERLLAAGIIAYGLVYPLLLKIPWRLAAWVEDRGIPAPPIYLWPFWVLGAMLQLRLFSFNEAEISELLIPAALTIFTLHYLISWKHQVEPHQTASWEKAVSRRFALQIAAVFIGVLSVSLLTTWTCYAHPRLGEGMEHRFWNGVEAFADRYERYEQWDKAAELYLAVNSERPGRALILRNIARCQLRMGNEEQFRNYISHALKVDHQRLMNDPERISVHISLAHTYHQSGEEQEAEKYLNNALLLALERAGENPDNPRAAYRLGRIYSMIGDAEAALLNFKKALELRPASAEYREAFLRAQSAVVDEGDRWQVAGEEEGPNAGAVRTAGGDAH